MKNIKEKKGWIVGVDVGGTFTDFCARENTSGKTVIHKRPSTPSDPSLGIIKGLDELKSKISGQSEVSRLAHGTTVATNALLQRKGGNIVLITTKGFRDLIEIGRQVRPKVYHLQIDSPQPLIDRRQRFEINERIGPNGEIIDKVLDSDISKLISDIKSIEKIDGFAVCLLFSFLNPIHEIKIKNALNKGFPGKPVSISSEVQPEFREYERFSTTVINSYLQPEVGKYLENLQSGFKTNQKNLQLSIFQSSGGLTKLERASKFPVRMALSGPAAGVVGATSIANDSRFKDLITLDMGGTSTDVCLIQEGKAEVTNMRDISGFRIRLPMIDINTVGAGGGSIAEISKDGLLKVGPNSAGAIPGPACYGQGGIEATVSDANIVLGRLPSVLVDGGMTLNQKLAEKAIKPLADRLNLSIEETALGIIGIVNSNMTRAIRKVSIERGHDPRKFSLMPFGGAGGLHAIDIARDLSMESIIVPRSPGILCAEGLILSDLQESFVSTCRSPLDGNLNKVTESLVNLENRAKTWFENEGSGDGNQSLLLIMDMRYIGQNYELSIIIGDVKNNVKLPNKEKLKDLFFLNHERSYGHFDPEAPIEIVNLRLRAITELDHGSSKPIGHNNDPKPFSENKVWFDRSNYIKTPVYSRDSLPKGFELLGPAIITQVDATTLLPPNCSLKIDKNENLIMSLRK